MDETDTQIIKKAGPLARWLLNIPSVIIDGTIVFLIAVLTGLASGFTQLIAAFFSDETAKFIAPQTLFWIKLAMSAFALIVGCVAAGLVNLQSFRNKVFSEHQTKKALEASKENG